MSIFRYRTNCFPNHQFLKCEMKPPSRKVQFDLAGFSQCDSQVYPKPLIFPESFSIVNDTLKI